MNKMAEEDKGRTYDAISYWRDFFDKTFEKESDRAVVILSAALLDNILESLLKTIFVANPSKEDDLFAGPNAPLSTQFKNKYFL
jgi:hypothetical protein